ncbi:MAG TPA: hypothetical protein PKA56_06635 [Solirubrobacterales bacterium]|nr:hypothetical protein [Solirubrobacterales bacterium]HMU27002.1 hypothetical protein [Solirubrobacterales bacterium]HMX71411.1 hypothetical protein [Solirubrobacterales bacterium]HMY26485.1 hypothetical protein [Solirubrobacterales bacterium]HNA24817.1 hypothetical protein [Solirubrobacterales bacterium]
MADERIDINPVIDDGGTAAVQEEVRTRRVRRTYVDPEVASSIGEVPPEPRPFSPDAPRANWESGIVFAVFAIIYGVLGYFMLTDGRIVDFISLAHLNEAYMVFWNDPPRLAAIGLDAATFSSIAYMPLSLVKPLATSLVAMPVLGAITAGLLMASLNSLMRICEINLIFRIVLLILFGLNPMFAFFAANGDPETLGLCLLAIALSSTIAWSVTDQTRHIAGAGLAMGLAVMVDYGYILVGLGFMVAIMIISASKNDDGLKTRSSLLLFLTPVAYALLFWCLMNWVLLGDPFQWVTAQNGVIQVNTTGALQAITTDVGGSLGDLFEVTLGVAPLALVAGFLLIIGSFLKKDATGWGLLVVGLCIAAAPVIRAVAADQADLLTISYGLPLAVFAVGAVAWFGKDGWGVVAAVILGVGLIAAIPLSWNTMRDYRFQNQAEAFTRWVEHRDSQEGTKSLGDYTVGIDPELSMARFINNKIPQEKRSILVDQNFSYGVMITSGRPQNFLDRVDAGEDDWQATIDNPWGKDGERDVSYMLITTSREGDQIAKKWPTAVQGGEAGFTPIFRTDRYVLVKVSETKPPSDESDQQSNEPRTTPNPVTPTSPLNPNGPDLTTPSQSETDVTPVSPSPSNNGSTVEPNNGTSSAPSLEGE